MSSSTTVRSLPLAGERFTGTESAAGDVPVRRHRDRPRPGVRPGRRRPRRGRSAKAALAGGPLPRWKRAEVLDRAARAAGRAPRRVRRDHRPRGGQADQDGTGRGRAGGRHVPVRRRRGAHAGRRRRRPRRHRQRRGQGRVHDARADRRRRRDQPVQLPAQPRRPQAGAGDRRRLPRRAQAGQPDAVQRHRPRRAADRRLRAAGRVAARRHRRRLDGRQRHRRPRRHRPDHVHRIARRRLVDPRAGAAQEGRARARQQRPGDHRGRQRLEGGGGEDQGRRLLPRRAELHLDAAGARPRRHRRRVPRRPRQGGLVAGRRRPDGRGHRRVGADLRGRARPGRGVDRRGDGAGRDGGVRRRGRRATGCSGRRSSPTSRRR